MEDIDTCYRHPLGFDVFKAKFWSSPDLSTPDYLNLCSPLYYHGGVPYSTLGGFQYPRTGNSHVGIYFNYNLQAKNKFEAEYFQGKLTRKLKIGNHYLFRCYYNIGLSQCDVNCVINNIGVAFTDTFSHDTGYFYFRKKLPTAININKEILTYETEKWIPYEFEFTADNSYINFFVGFLDTFNFKFKIVDTCNSTRNLETYIFFDDFRLVDLTEPQEYKPHISNVFTPNADGKNDEYISYWELDPPEKFSMKIYNRWGAKLFDTYSIFVGWDGKYMGNEVPEGAYFAQIIYTLDGVEHKINQPLYLLR